ncbi:hypothetical protein E6O75_ATG07655 [Venturia nashicola]|uniref:Uncharacterized protein n=1 Tax=Venturia nashicola TaxID=86259 RepID=A0A4Z1P747_9PEZI|nr:hypothetical protein E6O75_ATG07655 [Venturia nashicola]
MSFSALHVLSAASQPVTRRTAVARTAGANHTNLGLDQKELWYHGLRAFSSLTGARLSSAATSPVCIAHHSRCHVLKRSYEYLRIPTTTSVDRGDGWIEQELDTPRRYREPWDLPFPLIHTQYDSSPNSHTTVTAGGTTCSARLDLTTQEMAYGGIQAYRPTGLQAYTGLLVPYGMRYSASGLMQAILVERCTTPPASREVKQSERIAAPTTNVVGAQESGA